ncbi:HEPN domain-containing protein [Vibrio parahaemolyticus]|uniref:HEPN domain-containing protein n=1 Tax=Vibrio parahaemolyticus TaxID=670 RepID=UPI001E2DDA23|nr:HEPN domain-containing protein [Vibrio parahaemolyticus]
MELDFRRPPVYHFKKRLRRISIIKHISTDLKDNECNRYEYKDAMLNQFYILSMVALWQAHIEYTAEYYLENMVKGESNSRLLSVVEERKNKVIKQFNTPNVEKINLMFKELFNIPHLFKRLSSQGLSSKDTREKLDLILKCRHEIAHTAFCTSVALTEETRVDFKEFIIELAENLDSVLREEFAG